MLAIALLLCASWSLMHAYRARSEGAFEDRIFRTIALLVAGIIAGISMGVQP